MVQVLSCSNFLDLSSLVVQMECSSPEMSKEGGMFAKCTFRRSVLNNFIALSISVLTKLPFQEEKSRSLAA